MKKLINSAIVLFYLIVAIESPFWLAIREIERNNFQIILALFAALIAIIFLPKFISIFRDLDTQYDFNPLAIKTAICGAGILLLAHWVACGWLAIRGLANQNAFDSYIRSFYWAVSSLTTVGYGDIVPQSTAEYAYAILVMLLGVGMYAFIVGSIASLISQRDHAHAAYRERLEKLRSYLHYHQVPIQLRKRIWKYYNYLWENRLGLEEFNTLSEIPEPLRTEVAVYMVGDLLKASSIFKDASHELLSYLAPRLKPRLSMPGDTIIYEGSPAEEMYFISKGHAEVLKNNAKDSIAKLKAGDPFGEMALLSHSSLRNASVRALTVVEYYALDRASFSDTLKLFPNFAVQIELVAETRNLKAQNE